MTHRSRIVRRKRRTMRGGYVAQTIVELQKGGRKRSMRGGQFMSMTKFSEGGRKRRTMRGGFAGCTGMACGGRKRRTMRGGLLIDGTN